ncbi:hypothetical protein HPB50_023574 [Hyalomma asiaticum]|uniref:Uncharacterized protein n=1 Tax=Hyalomma asiaticum TaxID=266040 RepID=A0ACB7T485_HYAAI|nr:hypothetical protein HPB50_023574 [Hyalomma asiaticum]
MLSPRAQLWLKVGRTCNLSLGCLGMGGKSDVICTWGRVSTEILENHANFIDRDVRVKFLVRFFRMWVIGVLRRWASRDEALFKLFQKAGWIISVPTC